MLIGPMVYSFARVDVAVTMKVGDYFQHDKPWWWDCMKKEAGVTKCPASAAGISRDKKGPLSRTVGKGDRLDKRTMSRFDVTKLPVPMTHTAQREEEIDRDKDPPSP